MIQNGRLKQYGPIVIFYYEKIVEFLCSNYLFSLFVEKEVGLNQVFTISMKAGSKY